MKLLLILMLLAGGDAESEWRAWREKREADLRKPDGWLSLAGLFWLKEGDSTFGSAADNDLVFPRGPARIGTFSLRDGAVSMTMEGATRVLKADADVVTLGSMRWLAIVRDGRVAIRLKDSESPVRTGFRGLPTYPFDPRWRVTARFEPAAAGTTRRFPTAMGTETTVTVAGTLAFEVDGVPCRLEAIDEDGRLFIIFADATTGRETYGAGRYLYADPAGPDGTVLLDFNRAYNPPCAFTPYATCSYPPKQNRLTVRIEAGEQKYEEGGQDPS